MNKNYKSIVLAIGLCFALSASVSAAPHDLDPTFGNGGKVITTGIGGIHDIAIQLDGKIVAVGGDRIVRYNANGSLDTSFGGSGIVVIQLGDNISVRANALEVQTDGKIVVACGSRNAAAEYGVAVVRYNPNGTLDTTFNGTGKVITPVGTTNGDATGIAIQTDGKIVVAGWGHNANDSHSAVIRYHSNGSLDTSFNGTGRIVTPNGTASSIAIQPDGKIIVGGSSSIPGFTDFTTFRYSADGSPDASFGNAGRAIITSVINICSYCLYFSYANQVAIQSDGKIVAKGEIAICDDFSTYFFPLIVRHNPNGTLDTTFGINGVVYFYDYYWRGLNLTGKVAIQPDGKIVTVGDYATNFAVARYNLYGSPDSTFNGEGIVTTELDFQDEAFAVSNQADGKIVAPGSTSGNGNSGFALARYQGGSSANIRTRFDFDGDGRADVSVFRPSDRTWYLNQSTNGFSATQFGLSTDKITPADYDGDGKTDISVYRDGTWYWLNSSDNSFSTRQFGIASDIPVPGDYYAGGGRSELAVYRSGTWWILNLFNNQINTIQFGLASDKPVVGDYDGDGRADQAIYRNGEWHLNRSTQGYGIVDWGLATDKPVPADYDGDGKTDPAVYRDGRWYLSQSLQGWGEYLWGTATDIPAPADYDGDGKMDPAVYRDGVWYLLQSRGNVSIQQFGLPSDKPVASAFLP